YHATHRPPHSAPPRRSSDLAERVLIQAEFVQTRREIGLVQDTQHALLAVDRRHKRDPQINVAAADPDAHASVLGQTALGDVEVEIGRATRLNSSHQIISYAV